MQHPLAQRPAGTSIPDLSPLPAFFGGCPKEPAQIGGQARKGRSPAPTRPVSFRERFLFAPRPARSQAKHRAGRPHRLPRPRESPRRGELSQAPLTAKSAAASLTARTGRGGSALLYVASGVWHRRPCPSAPAAALPLRTSAGEIGLLRDRNPGAFRLCPASLFKWAAGRRK